MEEEMRTIEEEFAFQEKWIALFKRGKIFFQNIPEHLILRIITKEDLYAKKTYHFRQECWSIEFLETDKFPINISIINRLQPIIFYIHMKQYGPLSENFYIPARTKSFYVKYASISEYDFYKEIERFGSLPLEVTFTRRGHLELDELFSTLKEITQERHLHHPLQFLTLKRKSLTNYAIFHSWPMDSFFPSSDLFFFIVVAKSDVGVSVIGLYQLAKNEGDKFYSLQIMEIKSSDEWKKFTRRKIFNGHFSWKAGRTIEKSYKQSEILEDFNTQVADKFFEGGKLVYPPLAPEPEPAPELVEFLKKFEDFDIQPEKLAPHKPKWKKTEKLPELPRKLPEIHSNNWLIEAREVIKLRKIWLNFLQNKKFMLERLLGRCDLESCVLEVAKKMEHKHFSLFFSSITRVYDLIQNSASNFRIHGGRSCFSMKRIRSDSSGFKDALKSLEFYYLNEIRFDDFNDDTNYLKGVLRWVRERKIFVRRISLGSKCPLIQELFESFARGPKSLLVSQSTALPAPVKFSPQLKEIMVNVVHFGDHFKELLEAFTGIEQAVIWLSYGADDTNEIITHQLKTLKSKKCRSNILIRSRSKLPHIVNYNPQFDVSQIPPEVFIFRSMARGRGGVWNYFIRLEKAGFGAVGMALYLDSTQVEKDKLYQFNIRCEYFPTMESFLDYFEREVGSKRRARDWMQLREKDETIEPRKEDFKKLETLMPFIHFNEQKETDDFKKVWKRFFS